MGIWNQSFEDLRKPYLDEEITLTRGDYGSRNVVGSAWHTAAKRNFKGYKAGGGLTPQFKLADEFQLEGNQRDPEGQEKERKTSKQSDPSKDNFTGISGSIATIMKQNAAMKKAAKKKEKKESVEINHIDGSKTEIVDVVRRPAMVAAPKLSNWKEEMEWQDEALKPDRLKIKEGGVKNKIEINPEIKTEGYASTKRKEVKAALKRDRPSLSSKQRKKIASNVVKKKGDTSKSDDRYSYESKLWDQVAENLTELGEMNDVEFRVVGLDEAEIEEANKAERIGDKYGDRKLAHPRLQRGKRASKKSALTARSTADVGQRNRNRFDKRYGGDGSRKLGKFGSDFQVDTQSKDGLRSTSSDHAQKQRRSEHEARRGVKTKGVKKEQYSDWRLDILSEEEYDHWRDRNLEKYGTGWRGTDRSGPSSPPPSSKKTKGKTVLQRETEKKYGKGKSALDIVKAKIKAEHGKGAIMDTKKKK